MPREPRIFSEEPAGGGVASVVPLSVLPAFLGMDSPEGRGGEDGRAGRDRTGPLYGDTLLSKSEFYCLLIPYPILIGLFPTS